MLYNAHFYMKYLLPTFQVQWNLTLLLLKSLSSNLLQERNIAKQQLVTGTPMSPINNFGQQSY